MSSQIRGVLGTRPFSLVPSLGIPLQCRFRSG